MNQPPDQDRFNRFINQLLDRSAHLLGERPGLLPLIGIALIFINLILQFFPGSWFVDRHILLHIGLLISLFGMLLIRPLR